MKLALRGGSTFYRMITDLVFHSLAFQGAEICDKNYQDSFSHFSKAIGHLLLLKPSKIGENKKETIQLH